MLYLELKFSLRMRDSSALGAGTRKSRGRHMQCLQLRLGLSLSRHYLYAGAVAALLALPAQIARADEGGVSFWIPGFFGSLAAVPRRPRAGR